MRSEPMLSAFCIFRTPKLQTLPTSRRSKSTDETSRSFMAVGDRRFSEYKRDAVRVTNGAAWEVPLRRRVPADTVDSTSTPGAARSTVFAPKLDMQKSSPPASTAATVTTLGEFRPPILAGYRVLLSTSSPAFPAATTKSVVYRPF